MKGVFLDAGTLGNDISFELLKTLPIDWTLYKETSSKDTLERTKDAQIVITNKVVLNSEIIQKCSSLKLICVAATGYNNVDISAAKQFHVVVCNVPGYSTPSVVQITMTFILALSSSLIPYVEDVKMGKWQKHSQFCLLNHPILELQEKKLGIIGYGNLGKKVASVAESFGMQILIARHSDPVKQQVNALPLDVILSESDFLTLHIPLNDHTKNLIARPELEKMKKTSFLINTARGGIVNEKDLATCLKEGKIAGAGVDVLDCEPPSDKHPLLDPTIPNLLLTPHIAWASLESRQRLLKAITNNIRSFIEGNLKNVVS